MAWLRALGARAKPRGDGRLRRMGAGHPRKTRYRWSPVWQVSKRNSNGHRPRPEIKEMARLANASCPERRQRKHGCMRAQRGETRYKNRTGVPSPASLHSPSKQMLFQKGEPVQNGFLEEPKKSRPPTLGLFLESEEKKTRLKSMFFSRNEKAATTGSRLFPGTKSTNFENYVEWGLFPSKIQEARGRCAWLPRRRRPFFSSVCQKTT
jgi:hypothetical protein